MVVVVFGVAVLLGIVVVVIESVVDVVLLVVDVVLVVVLLRLVTVVVVAIIGVPLLHAARQIIATAARRPAVARRGRPAGSMRRALRRPGSASWPTAP